MKRAIRHFDKCSCNPANGGSGLCGCVIAQLIVGYEDDCCSNFNQTIIRSETCHLCHKILSTAEDLYWHLKSHREGLLNRHKFNACID